MRNKKTYGPSKPIIFLFLLPGFLVYTFSVLIPVISAAYYSLFNWTGGPNKTFIALSNYGELINDRVFRLSLRNNLVLTGLCIVGQIGLAFIFSSMLQSKLVKLKSLHRALAYFPVTVSAVVVGFVWGMMYDYNYGMLNKLLELVGMDSAIRPWLSESRFIMLKVSIPLIWQYIGFFMVILLAAYSSISTEVIEMSQIDGANGFKQALYITIPLIKNSLIVCLMLCISGNLKAFDHIFVMTSGGPGNASTVMAMYAYQTSFLKYRMGYGTALSIAIFIISFVLIVSSRAFLQKVSKKSNTD